MWWQTGSIANMTGNSLAMDLRAPRDSFCKATLLGPVWGLSGASLKWGPTTVARGQSLLAARPRTTGDNDGGYDRRHYCHWRRHHYTRWGRDCNRNLVLVWGQSGMGPPRHSVASLGAV